MGKNLNEMGAGGSILSMMFQNYNEGLETLYVVGIDQL
jgi:hypothetical protein